MPLYLPTFNSMKLCEFKTKVKKLPILRDKKLLVQMKCLGSFVTWT